VMAPAAECMAPERAAWPAMRRFAEVLWPAKTRLAAGVAARGGRGRERRRRFGRRGGAGSGSG